jgi:hypothetical protein
MLACCAFAVFLLQQLLIPFAFLRDRLFGKPAARPNASVLWSPGAVSAAPAMRRPALRPALAIVLVLEILAVGGSVAAASLAASGARPSAEKSFLTALHATICRAVGRAPT